jgi:hypothetical protein
MNDWIQHGIIFRPDRRLWWSQSHAMLPFPLLISSEVIRIYLNSFDKYGISRPGFIDVLAVNPKKVIASSKNPILDIGRPGCFDDNGVMSCSFLKKDKNSIYMYYVGFEECKKIRYRLFTGLAISNDSGLTFKRFQESPILERTSEEQFFRCAPFCLKEGSKYKMWYVGGNSWIKIKGKTMPKYYIKYSESCDGINWTKKSVTVLQPTKKNEYSFGRPFLYKTNKDYSHMIYSIRNISTNQYSLGYAQKNKKNIWKRQDEKMRLNKSDTSQYSPPQMYGSILVFKNKQYLFYNEDHYGANGLKFAERNL